MNEVSIINIEKLVISAILFDSSLFEETILKSKDFSTNIEVKIELTSEQFNLLMSLLSRNIHVT